MSYNSFASRSWLRIPRGLVWLGLLGLAFFSTACQPQSPPVYFTPTATPQAAPLSPPATPAFSPERTPQIQAPPAARSQALPIVLAGQDAVHPQSYYSLRPPSGWTATFSDSAATFRDPQASGRIELDVVNTGYTLDAAAFEKLARVWDNNRFAASPGYGVISSQALPDQGIVRLRKRLQVDGFPWVVESVYRQAGSAVIALDAWTSVPDQTVYAPGFQNVEESLEVDSTAVEQTLAPYAQRVEASCPNEACTFQAPLTWERRTFQGLYTLITSFTSPDEQAYIHAAYYDDQKWMSRSLAGSLALFVMHNYIAADVRVSKDDVIDDGRERLDWYSTRGSFHGVTTFGTAGKTAFVFFTIMQADDHSDLYGAILESVNASYQR